MNKDNPQIYSVDLSAEEMDADSVVVFAKSKSREVCPKCGSSDMDYSEYPTGYYGEDGFVDTGWSETDTCDCGYKCTWVFRNEQTS